MNQPAQQIDFPNEAPDVGQAEPPALPAVSGAGSLMEAISAAAGNPAVDVDKLDRLMALYERIEGNRAKTEFDAALAEMQDELPIVEERGEIRIGQGKAQKYALWEDINEAIKPVLSRHGFALSFRTGRDDGAVVVTGILSHRSGHREETTMHLPLDTSGSKNNVQAVGSSTSYGKRYTAAALLNLTSRGEDDDGVAGGAALISGRQLEEIKALIEETGADEPKFLGYAKVDGLVDIQAKNFDRLVTALRSKKTSNLKRPAEVSGRKEETANSRDRTEAITDTQPGGGRKPSPTSVEESAPAADAPGDADEGPGATGSETAVRSQSPGFSGPGADLINNALAAQMEAQNPRKGFENLLDRAGHPTGRVGKALDRVRHFYQRFEDGEIDRDELSERVAAIIDGSIPV